MYDFVTYSSNPKNLNKNNSPSITHEPFSISFKAMNDFNAGKLITENPKLPNSKLLMSYAQVIENSAFDCFSITLTFSGRSEDSHSKKRIEFFSKYFLFDQSHYDVM